MSLVVRPADWDDPDGVALREEQRIEIDGLYGGVDTEPGPKPTAADVTAYFIAYQVAEDGTETAAACGALRQIDAEHGEVKRMYVHPDYRGRYASVAVLRALEGDARARGWNRLVLETGPAQLAAIRFYEREGFTQIPNFGYYADSEFSICYGKAL